VVIDFTVKRKLYRAFGIGHRLACIVAQIDNGKAQVRKPNFLVVRKPRAGTIRAAMRHGAVQADQFVVPDLRRGGKSKNTGNAAHVMKPFQNLANTILCACL